MRLRRLHQVHNRIAGLERRAAKLEQIRAETRKLSGKLYELALLHDIWQAAKSVQSVRELLDCVLDTCMQMLGAESGSILLFDKDSGELVLGAAKGRLAETLRDVRQKLDEGVAGYVATALQPLFVADIEKDGRFQRRTSGRHTTGSFVSVPLLENDELVGVISFHDKRDGKAFEPQDVKQLLVAARYSASAIVKLSRHELLEEFNRELHARLDGALAKLADTNRELSRLRSYNEGIVRSIPLGLLTFNQSFEITFCNQRGEEIFGTVAGMSLLELDVTEKGRSWSRELAAVIETGDVVRFDSAAFVPASGDRSFVVRSVATPLRDAEGAIVGGVAVVEDITARVRMERMLAASERHAVIGKLAARVAHELNNPLDGIMRFVNLSLALTKDDPRMQTYMQEMRKGLERMAGIVGSLLEFSRNPHRGNRIVQTNDAVNETIASIKYRAEDLHVKIETDLAPNLPMPGCDLTQVLLNLSKNALDAMPDGGTLRFGTALRDGTVIITVADTGAGMSPAVMKRLFDPFFTTKERGKGTGLGLAICHDMIEKHRGTIGVESTEGTGTTFTIKLPAS